MKFQSRINRSVALILTLFIGSLSAIAQDAPLQGLDNYVNKALKDWDVPGVAIAIIKDDKIVFAKGYGVREIGKPDKVDERTLFAIGSSTKAFTAASIAMLVDDGKIRWDDPATKYLPDFQLYDPTVTREMTVRDLLTHRIGLERRLDDGFKNRMRRITSPRSYSVACQSWSPRSNPMRCVNRSRTVISRVTVGSYS